MNQQLNNFYNNESQRETVKAFLINVLEEITIDRAFKGEPVGGVPDAKVCIDTAFDKLEEMYGKIEEPIRTNSK